MSLTPPPPDVRVLSANPLRCHFGTPLWASETPAIVTIIVTKNTISKRVNRSWKGQIISGTGYLSQLQYLTLVLPKTLAEKQTWACYP